MRARTALLAMLAFVGSDVVAKPSSTPMFFSSIPELDDSVITAPQGPEWAQNAVFYQIYPQSFQDSNGDGIGDLKGITARLGYVRSLGIDAIWLNPFYVSPFRDAGYDVADYKEVAPRYGTNEDAKTLFEEAHKRGLKVIIDLVPGHTSIDHPWFKESCKPEKNKYSNWYVWTSSTWFSGMENYKEGFVQGYCDRDGNYLSNFFWHQPALNFGYGELDPAQPWQLPIDHPDILTLREEFKSIMRYWLDMGCDGFRVDMAGSLVKNDPAHRILDFWRDVRDMLDRDYPQAFIISEWSDPKVALNNAFHADFMHWFPGYNSLWADEGSFFSKMGKGNITTFLRAYLPQYEATRASGYISLPVGNHDLDRIRRHGRQKLDLEMIYVFQFTMPNVPFIYYGDEIGMRHIYGLRSREGSYGRAGCRTPMQWDKNEKNMGFSSADKDELYFPQDPAEDAPSVAEEIKNEDSLLHFVRKLIKIKKEHPALANYGSFKPIYAKPGEYPFIYLRENGEDKIIVALNPSEKDIKISLKNVLPGCRKLLLGQGIIIAAMEGETWFAMPPRSYAVYQLDTNLEETGKQFEGSPLPVE